MSKATHIPLDNIMKMTVDQYYTLHLCEKHLYDKQKAEMDKAKQKSARRR